MEVITLIASVVAITISGASLWVSIRTEREQRELTRISDFYTALSLASSLLDELRSSKDRISARLNEMREARVNESKYNRVKDEDSTLIEFVKGLGKYETFLSNQYEEARRLLDDFADQEADLLLSPVYTRELSGRLLVARAKSSHTLSMAAKWIEDSDKFLVRLRRRRNDTGDMGDVSVT